MRKLLQPQSHDLDVSSRTDEPGPLIELSELSNSKKDIDQPLTPEQLITLFNFGKKRQCGKSWIARNQRGLAVSALYMTWDSRFAYYNIGCSHPDHTTTGAMSLLMWTAIQHAGLVTKAFNFEGSMIASVERFFRGFGGIQTPYFQVSRTSSKILKIKDIIT